MASMLSSSRTSAVSAVMARFASFLEFTVSQLFYFTKSLAGGVRRPLAQEFVDGALGANNPVYAMWEGR